MHKPVSVPEALKISEAKAAVDGEWNQLQTVPAWDAKRVRPKSEVIRQSKKDGQTAHFARRKDGGLILWNVNGICEVSKNSWQSELAMKDGLVNQLTGQ